MLASGIGSYPPPISIAGGRAQVSGSLLFSHGRGIYDTTTSQVVRTITPIPNLMSILPAPDVNRVFALGAPVLGSSAQIVSLDNARYSQIAVINLPSSVSGNIANGSLQRMGTTGLAYTTIGSVRRAVIPQTSKLQSLAQLNPPPAA